MRSFVFALAATALVAPAFVAPAPAEAKRVYKEWRGKDGRLYCRRTDGATDLIIGGVGGALLGRTTDTRGTARWVRLAVQFLVPGSVVKLTAKSLSASAPLVPLF
jgi:hypothetical protein